jgi:hypothetical protein
MDNPFEGITIEGLKEKIKKNEDLTELDKKFILVNINEFPIGYLDEIRAYYHLKDSDALDMTLNEAILVRKREIFGEEKIEREKEEKK